MDEEESYKKIKDQQVIKTGNGMPDRGAAFPSCDFFEGSVTVAGFASFVSEAGAADFGEPVDRAVGAVAFD